jgi:hypothetical protein
LTLNPSIKDLISNKIPRRVKIVPKLMKNPANPLSTLKTLILSMVSVLVKRGC